VFFERGMERPVVTILTLTRVPANDPAFANPTKPIGPFYERDDADRLAAERGWALRPDPHGGCRRVVPSPTPCSIVEAPVIRTLVGGGVILIASGGGGVPVIEDGLRLVGVEGVVDKDSAAAILAHDVEASALLILTDVPRVQRGFGTNRAEELERLTTVEARALAEAGEFAAGSMGPKVEAEVSFVDGGGTRAAIGDLDEAAAVLSGAAGTTIVPA
jgi:carbamate kinase